LRRKHPYLDYDQYDFDVVIGSAAIVMIVYLVRLEEMRQSARILRRSSIKTAGRSDHVSNWKNMTPPKSR